MIKLFDDEKPLKCWSDNALRKIIPDEKEEISDSLNVPCY